MKVSLTSGAFILSIFSMLLPSFGFAHLGVVVCCTIPFCLEEWQKVVSAKDKQEDEERLNKLEREIKSLTNLSQMRKM